MITSKISYIIFNYIYHFLLKCYKKKQKSKNNIYQNFFVLAFITLLMINIKGRLDGIILNENTFIMNDPSSGSDVYKLIRKGEKIKIVNETDVWYEVEQKIKNIFVKKIF